MNLISPTILKRKQPQESEIINKKYKREAKCTCGEKPKRRFLKSGKFRFLCKCRCNPKFKNWK